jgi:hypothetical protein
MCDAEETGSNEMQCNDDTLRTDHRLSSGILRLALYVDLMDYVELEPLHLPRIYRHCLEPDVRCHRNKTFAKKSRETCVSHDEPPDCPCVS